MRIVLLVFRADLPTAAVRYIHVILYIARAIFYDIAIAQPCLPAVTVDTAAVAV